MYAMAACGRSAKCPPKRENISCDSPMSSDQHEFQSAGVGKEVTYTRGAERNSDAHRETRRLAFFGVTGAFETEPSAKS
jgi:hypothetical protein